MTNVVKEIETTQEAAIMLPEEVQSLAMQVAPDKKEEVQTVLNQIFTGTSDWAAQVEAIQVKDVNDLMSINMADSARLNIKKARLAAEKIFDAKRSEVQQKMADFKTEDALWLKAKQVMVIKFKAIEEKAEWKAKFIERYEAEQKALRTEMRISKAKAFNPEISQAEVENMSDASFDAFLSGLEKSYIDKIEAEKKAEAERVAREKAEAEEKARMIAENERLKKEAEEKERAFEQERKRQQAILEAERKKADELLEAKRKEAERVKAIADAKLKEEQAAKAKLEAEIRAKEAAEAKAKKEAEERAAAELKAKQLAEKKAKAAPDKVKLAELSKMIGSIQMPEVKSEEATAIIESVKALLNKVCVFINEKSETL